MALPLASSGIGRQVKTRFPNPGGMIPELSRLPSQPPPPAGETSFQRTRPGMVALPDALPQKTMILPTPDADAAIASREFATPFEIQNPPGFPPNKWTASNLACDDRASTQAVRLAV